MTSPSEIWTLLRHAESQANAQKVWTGQIDVPLSEKGALEAARLARQGSLPRGDFFVSSPLIRCLDSLRLFYNREPDLIVEEFMECDLGAWVGVPYENLTTDPRYLSWLEQPDLPPPGGESLETFKKRVTRGLQKTRSAARKGTHNELILVLHGNVMRALLCLIVDPSRAHHEWPIPNNGGYRLELQGDRATVCQAITLT
ncbi:MAG: histidine phosphatase family protein [Fretibacterium sp.]|nr:histidine phosphatase family protein [Fretibacterium sp.]